MYNHFMITFGTTFFFSLFYGWKIIERDIVSEMVAQISFFMGFYIFQCVSEMNI